MLTLLLAFELPNVFHQLCVQCVFFWQGPVEGGLSLIQPGFSDPLIWHHFLKRTCEKLKPRWGTDLSCVQKLDLSRIYILQMRKQTPIVLRVHTGANVELGLQFMSCGSQFQLISTLQHCILNCPMQIYIPCLRVLFFLGQPCGHKLQCPLGLVRFHV